MDHGLCFIRSNEELDKKLNRIDKVQEAYIYGLFQAFRTRLKDRIITDCMTQLRKINEATAEAIIQTVPRQWDVGMEARKAWADLICRRAHFVADNIQDWIERDVPLFGNPGR